MGLAFAVVLLTLVWARLGAPQASAQDGHPGLNFWIAVYGVPNCSTQNGDATCSLAPNASFVVAVFLGPLPADVPGYSGFDIYLAYQGVIFKQNASMDAWPDCGFPATLFSRPNVVLLACAEGVDASPSTYAGLIATTSFTCGQSGSVSMLHGSDNYTDLVPAVGSVVSENPNTSEKLTINCVTGGVVPPTPSVSGARTSIPPGATLEPAEKTAAAGAAATATAQGTSIAKQTPTTTPGGAAGGGGSGSNTWIIVIVVVVIVVVAGGGLIGWRYMQSRPGDADGS